MDETWFEPVATPSGRTETGTTATRGRSGSSSPSWRNRRSAPVQTARTTSFTVVPMAFFNRFTSSRRMAEKATRRRRLMAALNEVRGAERGRAAFGPDERSSCRRRTRRTSKIRKPVRTKSSATSTGRMAPVTRAPATSSTPEGTRSSTRAGSGGGRSAGSASRSKSTDSSAAPETPSTVEWCILATRAMRPPSTPSTTQISHIGLLRSSCWPAMSPARSPSSRSPPGRGTAARRTWYSMSKSASSTHTGCPRRNGTSTSRRRKTGSALMRAAMRSRNRSKR